MFLITEKKLLKKNYKGYHNPPNTTYISNTIQTNQISMDKIMLEDYTIGWKVSFPLKSSVMNYATLFKTENAAKKYLEKMVNNYI
jgi:hypothetical protein